LCYDDEYENVQSWGFSSRPTSRKKKLGKLVDLSKFILGDVKDEIPISYEKAITDYLHKFGSVIVKEVYSRWRSIDFYNNVLIILTVINSMFL